MKIKKSFVIKIFVDGKSHVMSDTQHGSERIRTWAQVRNLPEKFKRMPFLLQRKCFRIGSTIHFNFFCLDF